MHFNNKHFLQICEIYRPFRKAFIILAILVGAAQALAMVSPLFLGKIIDGFNRGVPANTLAKFAFAMLGLSALELLIKWKHDVHQTGKISFPLVRHIPTALTLPGILKFSLGQITNTNSGFKLDVVKKGESSLYDTVDTLIFGLIPAVIKMLAGIVALLLVNAYFGTIILVCAAGFVTSSIIINQRMLPDLKRYHRNGNKLGTAYTEIIKHLRLVIVNNQEKQTIENYAAEYDKLNEEGKRIWFGYFKNITLYREPFIYLGQFALLLLGIYMVDWHRATPGDLVMAMAWAALTFSAMNNIGSMQRHLAEFWVKTCRYLELLDMPPAVVEVKNPIKPAKFYGRIEFRGVFFKYPKFVSQITDEDDDEDEDEPEEAAYARAVEDVSFVIPAGSTCALVGPSGSGKTTILNLCFRGYDPDRGQILIDNNDLRLLHLGNWRSSVGWVEQESKLWDATLGRNMAYGRPDSMTDSELDDLARLTRIDEFYDRLGPRPFDTIIGENGVQLSGGQRQRVAIARAIAKSPSVLVFDEATNAIDMDNEHLIYEAIREALKGRTGIIIAHRLSTIRYADQILVFKKGRIVGRGRHDELMQTCSHYSRLVKREAEVLVG